MDAAERGYWTSQRAAQWRAFLIFQIVFWGANLAIRTLAAIEHRPDFAFAYMPQRVLIISASFAATTCIHFLLTKVDDWPQAARLGLGFALCLALLPPMNALESGLTRRVAPDASDVTFADYVLQFGWAYLMWAGYYLAQDLLFRTRRDAERLAEARQQAHDAQLKMLRYQLNPHFLFNSLNAISTLVLEHRNEDAESMLLNLSRFLQHAAYSGASPFGRLGDEAQVQRLYLEVEAVRFGDKLQVECDVPEGLHDLLVPTLLLQPIIENAINHGVAKLPGGGWIRIRARCVEARLVLSVENEGPQLAGDWRREGGIGLRNTADRLHQIYGDAGRCELTPLPGGGARVEISMPRRAVAVEKLLGAV